MHELNEMKIEIRPIEALIPYARNPRVHNEAQIAQIAASMVEFGWTQPILVDGSTPPFPAIVRPASYLCGKC